MAIFYIFYGILDDYIEEMLAILNFYNMVEIQTMILFLFGFFSWFFDNFKVFYFTIARFFIIRKKVEGVSLQQRNKRQQYFAYLGIDFHLFSKCSRLLHFVSWKLLLCRLVRVPTVSSSAAPSRRAASAAAAATAATKTVTWPSPSSRRS